MSSRESSVQYEQAIFTTRHTQIIKGFAILLMLIHHLFTFPQRMASDVNVISSFRLFAHTAHYEWGHFGRICVSLFMFVSGFGLYRKQMNGRPIKILSIVKELYIRYWRIFILFVPLGFLYFGYARPEFPESLRVFSHLDWKIVISDFFGFTAEINTEWWFLKNYIICMCFFPLWAGFVKNHRHEQNILAVALMSVFFSQIFPYLDNVVKFPLMDTAEYNLLVTSMDRYTVASFFMGVAFAKDHLLEQLHHEIAKPGIAGIFQDVFLFCMVFFCRQYGFGQGFDWIYAVVICLIVWDLTDHCKGLGKVYHLYGKHSTNIWLFHTFLCYYYDEVQRIVYAPRYPLLIAVFFAALCLAVSIGIEVFYSMLSRIFQIAGRRLKRNENCA